MSVCYCLARHNNSAHQESVLLVNGKVNHCTFELRRLHYRSHLSLFLSPGPFLQCTLLSTATSFFSKHIITFMGIIRVQFMFLSASSSLSGTDYKSNTLILLVVGAALMMWFEGKKRVSAARVGDFSFVFTDPDGIGWWNWNLLCSGYVCCVLTWLSPKCSLKAGRGTRRTLEWVTQRWKEVVRIELTLAALALSSLTSTDAVTVISMNNVY